MLPLKALSFWLWLIVVDPCFITRYNSFEKTFYFSRISIFQLLTDLKLGFFCERPWVVWEPVSHKFFCTATCLNNVINSSNTLIYFSLINSTVICLLSRINASIRDSREEVPTSTGRPLRWLSQTFVRPLWNFLPVFKRLNDSNNFLRTLITFFCGFHYLSHLLRLKIWSRPVVHPQCNSQADSPLLTESICGYVYQKQLNSWSHLIARLPTSCPESFIWINLAVFEN